MIDFWLHRAQISIYFSINTSIDWHQIIMYSWNGSETRISNIIPSHSWRVLIRRIIVVCKCFTLRGQFSLRYHSRPASFGAARGAPLHSRAINQHDRHSSFSTCSESWSQGCSTLVITRRASFYNSKYARTHIQQRCMYRTFVCRQFLNCESAISGGSDSEDNKSAELKSWLPFKCMKLL